MSTNAAVSLSWRRALAWRMERHHLVERAAPADLARVTDEICGLHAQVMSAAEFALWSRIDGLPRDAVREALWTTRSLVKLWAMRGTLHLLPAAELGTWLAALGTLPSRFGGASAGDVDAVTKAIPRALGDRTLSREELATEVERLTRSPRLGEWVRSGWGSALKASSFRGVICFAPSEGTQVRFTSPAAWLGGPVEQPPAEEGLRAVARRFLHAYGPATAGDLGRWWREDRSGRRVAPMLDALGEEVVRVDLDGQPALALAGDVEGIARAKSPNVARLLPAFDPWVVGMTRREPLIDPSNAGRVFGGQGQIRPVILVNGRVAGTWRHAQKSKRSDVELEPFEPLPGWADRQLKSEVRRFEAFLG